MPARVIRRPLGDKTDKAFKNVAALECQTEYYRSRNGGKMEPARRKTLAFRLRGYSGPGYYYSGATRAHLPAARVLEKLGSAANKILKRLGIDQEVNTGIATYYPGRLPGVCASKSRNGLGYHSDTSRNLKEKSAIVAFCFGEARPLKLRNNKTREVTEVKPGHGDAYVMLPGSQEEEKHCVPYGSGERWSVTFRTVV